MKKHFFYNTDIGQNFLIDRKVVDFIIERSSPQPNDVVLEIGPGDGVLTRALLATQIKRLYTVEVDERLREKLDNIHDARCEFIWCDALKFDYASLPERPTKIIANLPYHITTPLMWKFLEELVPTGIDYMLLMLQLESAERIAQSKGGRSHSPLGVTVSAMGSAEIVRQVPPSAFNPRPKVNSALLEVKIKSSEKQNADLANNKKWRELLSASFAQRRKTLVNNWTPRISRERALDILGKNNLKPTARAEELTLEEWFALAEIFGE